MDIKIPYGKTHLKTYIDDKRIAGVIEPLFLNADDALTAKDRVKNALVHPIASERLSCLAGDKRKVLIITSDHTRPVPSKIAMHLLLEEIRNKNEAVEIKNIIATGLHRVTTKQEMIEKFGQAIVE